MVHVASTPTHGRTPTEHRAPYYQGQNRDRSRLHPLLTSFFLSRLSLEVAAQSVQVVIQIRPQKTRILHAKRVHKGATRTYLTHGRQLRGHSHHHLQNQSRV
jgi:hypothetical protein